MFQSFLAAGCTLFLAASAHARNAPDRVLVRFRPGAPAAAVRAAIADAGGRDLGGLDAIRFHVVTLPPGRTVAETIARLARNPDVEVAEPDMVIRAAGLPNDPDLGQQWSLDRIGAKAAWAANVPGATGSAAVVIAVVDSGCATAHVDLTPKLVSGYNLNNPSSLQGTLDDFGHGTVAAGIAAAATDNGAGIAGVAWQARIMPVKVLNAQGETTESVVLEGVQWAVDHGAQVINMSLGSCADKNDCGSASAAGIAMMTYAHARGAVLVAAAGNESTENTSYPAGYPYVMGVSATGPDDRLTTYSNFGTAIDVAAPGGSDCLAGLGLIAPCANAYICYAPAPPCSGTPNDSYEFYVGTSFAAPIVSGIAAVLLGAHPDWTPDQVATRIEASAEQPLGGSGWNRQYGYGRVNLERALTGAVTAPPAGATGDLGYAWPNPYNPALDGFQTFVFTGAPAGAVTVELFDAAGNAVRKLEAAAGADLYYNSPLRWDGRDTAGRDLAGGIYLARFTAGGTTSVKRIVLAR